MALSLWSAASVTVFYTIPVLVMGVLAGSWAGARTGQALARQLAEKGRIVLYSEDTPLYALLVPVATGVLAPVTLWWVLMSMWKWPALQTVFVLVLCFLSLAWLSHDLSLARHLWLLTERVGLVPIQWFHARSVVGPEGTIGQRGVVLVECKPDGYIRLQGERWRARSQHGIPLRVGDVVEVQQIDGLLVVVAGVTDEPEDGVS